MTWTEWLTVGGAVWVVGAVVLALIIGAVVRNREKQKPN